MRQYRHIAAVVAALALALVAAPVPQATQAAPAGHCRVDALDDRSMVLCGPQSADSVNMLALQGWRANATYRVYWTTPQAESPALCGLNRRRLTPCAGAFDRHGNAARIPLYFDRADRRWDALIVRDNNGAAMGSLTL